MIYREKMTNEERKPEASLEDGQFRDKGDCRKLWVEKAGEGEGKLRECCYRTQGSVKKTSKEYQMLLEG